MPGSPRIPGTCTFLEKFELVSICHEGTSSPALYFHYMITEKRSQGQVCDLPQVVGPINRGEFI